MTTINRVHITADGADNEVEFISARVTELLKELGFEVTVKSHTPSRHLVLDAVAPAPTTLNIPLTARTVYKNGNCLEGIKEFGQTVEEFGRNIRKGMTKLNDGYPRKEK